MTAARPRDLDPRGPDGDVDDRADDVGADTWSARLPWPLAVTAAALRGPADLLDFLLPLWVGVAWGLPPPVIGALVAVEAAASLLGRPLAGLLVDRGRPALVAAAGAGLYALSFLAYAVAGHPAVLFAAAVTGGLGGSLAWVALRALTGAVGTDQGRSFSDLVAAEGNGTWIAFLAGLTLLPQIDYRGVFFACAATCAVGAGVIGLAGRSPATDRSTASVDYRTAAGRMRAFLAVIALTAAAEAGVALLMLLHLQRGFGLDVGAIAAVFLPGFIVYSIAPPYLNRIVRRRGRTAVLVVALGGSAAFAVGLAVAPTPWVISGLWILAAVSWAAATPIHQAVVAEVAPGGLGRALALYETATLVGVLAGGGAAGLLYGSAGGWELACVVAAAVMVLAAALTPMALSRTGRAGGGRTSPDTGRPPTDGRRSDDARPPDGGAQAGPGTRPRAGPARFDASNWLFHLGVWTVAQIALAIAGQSWPWEALVGGPHDADWWWNDSGSALLNAGRIWTVILLLDTAYTATRWVIARVRRRRVRT